MTTEIERKFVLSEVPGADVLGDGEELRQGYVAEEDDVVVRVRITDEDATLTIKAGGGLSRTEVELSISKEEAEALWPHTDGRRIHKTRHRVAGPELGDHVADIDVYAGALAGLYTAEVEFDSEQRREHSRHRSGSAVRSPASAEWTNAALARHGLPR